jgi:hypothetical protein
MRVSLGSNHWPVLSSRLAVVPCKGRQKRAVSRDNGEPAFCFALERLEVLRSRHCGVSVLGCKNSSACSQEPPIKT